MPKYFVLVREVHIATIEVDAENPRDAIRCARDGNGTYHDNTEYSHTLESDLWQVEDENGKDVTPE